MDFWASLEHQIKYKKAVPDQAEIIAQLKACSDEIARTELCCVCPHINVNNDYEPSAFIHDFDTQKIYKLRINSDGG